jgi:hypothetical protein
VRFGKAFSAPIARFNAFTSSGGFACHISEHFGDLRQEEDLILGNRKSGILFIAFFKVQVSRSVADPLLQFPAGFADTLALARVKVRRHELLLGCRGVFDCHEYGALVATSVSRRVLPFDPGRSCWYVASWNA